MFQSKALSPWLGLFRGRPLSVSFLPCCLPDLKLHSSLSGENFVGPAWGCSYCKRLTEAQRDRLQGVRDAAGDFDGGNTKRSQLPDGFTHVWCWGFYLQAAALV